MKCKECEAEGKQSRVYVKGGMSTCMAWSSYYDEAGVYHSHDPNWHTQNYECSNGHVWSDKKRARCPAEGCAYGE